MTSVLARQCLRWSVPGLSLITEFSANIGHGLPHNGEEGKVSRPEYLLIKVYL